MITQNQIEQKLTALDKQIRMLNAIIEDIGGPVKEVLSLTPASGVSLARSNAVKIGDVVYLNCVITVSSAKSTGNELFHFTDTTIKPSALADIHLVPTGAYPRVAYIGANSNSCVANGSVPAGTYFIQLSFVL